MDKLYDSALGGAFRELYLVQNKFYRHSNAISQVSPRYVQSDETRVSIYLVFSIAHLRSCY